MDGHESVYHNPQTDEKTLFWLSICLQRYLKENTGKKDGAKCFDGEHTSEFGCSRSCGTVLIRESLHESNYGSFISRAIALLFLLISSWESLPSNNLMVCSITIWTQQASMIV